MKELTPRESWAHLQARLDTLFVDVRMEIEYLYVGHPPGVVHLAWYECPSMTPDVPEFVRRVLRAAGATAGASTVYLGGNSRPTALQWVCGSGTASG